MASIEQRQPRLTGRSINPHRVTALASALCSAALLSACLGGGGDGGAGDAVAAAPVLQVVKVVDGPIKGTLVRLDRNENGGCDTDEVQGTTAEDGTVTFSDTAADSLPYPVIALVGVGAVDADNGPVATAYVMGTPPDRPGLVTPLTTLLTLQAAAPGVGTADAEKMVQYKLGTSAALLADYSGKRDADSAYAATVAWLVVMTSQQQALATVGAKDASGIAVPQVDVVRAIHDSLLTQLTALAAAAVDPALAAAGCATEREAAIQIAAAGVAANAGLTTTNLASVLAVAKLLAASDPAGTLAAAETLRWFCFTDAQNYSFRMFKTTAEQTVVVAGLRQANEYREQSVGSNGTVTFDQQWGEGLNNLARNQVVHHHTTSDVVNPDAYNTITGDTVAVYVTTVANGNATQCNRVTASHFEQFRVGPATLEQMVAGAPGVPCVYGLPANSGESANDWWSNSTLGTGDVPDP